MKIEKGIPAPVVKPRAKRQNWPFSKMEIGDSVLIDRKSGLPIDRAQNVCHVYARQRAIRGHECKFVTRTVDAGVRIWRVA